MNNTKKPFPVTLALFYFCYKGIEAWRVWWTVSHGGLAAYPAKQALRNKIKKL